MQLRLGGQDALLGLKTVAGGNLDDGDALGHRGAKRIGRHGARIVARMQRPKGNDLRRAGFDGPADLAPFFRDGRLEIIPAAQDRRLALLRYIADRFSPERDYAEDAVNRVLQAVHGDHATLRRYLVDAGLLSRARNTYRRV